VGKVDPVLMPHTQKLPVRSRHKTAKQNRSKQKNTRRKNERIFVITPKQLNRPFHNFLSIPEAINSKID
jgi:hypothetical protein